MSLSKRLRLLAVGAALASPMAQAQTEKTPEKAPAPITQTAQSSWTWTEGFSSPELRATYDSLPKEYKAFANKSFMERAEMREEWEQRDYIKRSQQHKKQVQAGTVDPSLKPAEGDYETHILMSRFNGELTPSQSLMAQDLVRFGRPLSTIDPHKSYSDQLRDCGFDVFASAVDGKRESSLSARDHALLIWQVQDAEQLKDIGQNRDAWREYMIRSQKESNEEYEKSSSFLSRLFAKKTRYLTDEEAAKIPVEWENLNGKKVIVPLPNQTNYSVRDEVTRNVAKKIANEQAMTQQLKSKQATH